MSEMADKREALLKELEEKSKHEHNLAVWSHWLNVSAMLLTLLTTALAVGYGLIPKHLSQITAGLALIPGGVALIAISLKLESRCNWHYKKHYALNELIRKLTLELPIEPTQDQLTEVSQSLGKLEIDSEVAWEATLSLDWTRFRKP
jgi:hypothetical protein